MEFNLDFDSDSEDVFNKSGGDNSSTHLEVSSTANQVSLASATKTCVFTDTRFHVPPNLFSVSWSNPSALSRRSSKESDMRRHGSSANLTSRSSSSKALDDLLDLEDFDSVSVADRGASQTLHGSLSNGIHRRGSLGGGMGSESMSGVSGHPGQHNYTASGLSPGSAHQDGTSSEVSMDSALREFQELEAQVLKGGLLMEQSPEDGASMTSGSQFDFPDDMVGRELFESLMHDQKQAFSGNLDNELVIQAPLSHNIGDAAASPFNISPSTPSLTHKLPPLRSTPHLTPPSSHPSRLSFPSSHPPSSFIDDKSSSHKDNSLTEDAGSNEPQMVDILDENGLTITPLRSGSLAWTDITNDINGNAIDDEGMTSRLVEGHVIADNNSSVHSSDPGNTLEILSITGKDPMDIGRFEKGHRDSTDLEVEHFNLIQRQQREVENQLRAEESWSDKQKNQGGPNDVIRNKIVITHQTESPQQRPVSYNSDVITPTNLEEDDDTQTSSAPEIHQRPFHGQTDDPNDLEIVNPYQVIAESQVDPIAVHDRLVSAKWAGGTKHFQDARRTTPQDMQGSRVDLKDEGFEGIAEERTDDSEQDSSMQVTTSKYPQFSSTPTHRSRIDQYNRSKSRASTTSNISGDTVVKLQQAQNTALFNNPDHNSAKMKSGKSPVPTSLANNNDSSVVLNERKRSRSRQEIVEWLESQDGQVTSPERHVTADDERDGTSNLPVNSTPIGPGNVVQSGGRSRQSSTESDDHAPSNLAPGRMESRSSLKQQLKQEWNTREKQSAYIEQLHSNFENLLVKHALAEETIDQLRIGARVRLDYTGRSATSLGELTHPDPTTRSKSALSRPMHTQVDLSSSLNFQKMKPSNAFIVDKFASLNTSSDVMGLMPGLGYHRSLPATPHGSRFMVSGRQQGEPNDGWSDAKMCVMLRLEQLQEAVNLLDQEVTDWTHSGEAGEQENELDDQLNRVVAMRKECDLTETELKEASQLFEASNSFSEGEFDPDNELEGQLFELGMRLDEIDTSIRGNLKMVNRRTPYRTPSRPQDSPGPRTVTPTDPLGLSTSLLTSTPQRDSGNMGFGYDNTSNTSSPLFRASVPRKGTSLEPQLLNKMSVMEEEYENLMERYNAVKNLVEGTPGRNDVVDNLMQQLRNLSSEAEGMSTTIASPGKLEEMFIQGGDLDEGMTSDNQKSGDIDELNVRSKSSSRTSNRKPPSGLDHSTNGNHNNTNDVINDLLDDPVDNVITSVPNTILKSSSGGVGGTDGRREGSLYPSDTSSATSRSSRLGDRLGTGRRTAGGRGGETLTGGKYSRSNMASRGKLANPGESHSSVAESGFSLGATSTSRLSTAPPTDLNGSTSAGGPQGHRFTGGDTSSMAGDSGILSSSATTAIGERRRHAYGVNKSRLANGDTKLVPNSSVGRQQRFTQQQQQVPEGESGSSSSISTRRAVGLNLPNGSRSGSRTGFQGSPAGKSQGPGDRTDGGATSGRSELGGKERSGGRGVDEARGDDDDEREKPVNGTSSVSKPHVPLLRPGASRLRRQGSGDRVSDSSTKRGIPPASRSTPVISGTPGGFSGLPSMAGGDKLPLALRRMSRRGEGSREGSREREAKRNRHGSTTSVETMRSDRIRDLEEEVRLLKEQLGAGSEVSLDDHSTLLNLDRYDPDLGSGDDLDDVGDSPGHHQRQSSLRSRLRRQQQLQEKLVAQQERRGLGDSKAGADARRKGSPAVDGAEVDSWRGSGREETIYDRKNRGQANKGPTVNGKRGNSSHEWNNGAESDVIDDEEQIEKRTYAARGSKPSNNRSGGSQRTKDLSPTDRKSSRHQRQQKSRPVEDEEPENRGSRRHSDLFSRRHQGNKDQRRSSDSARRRSGSRSDGNGSPSGRHRVARKSSEEGRGSCSDSETRTEYSDDLDNWTASDSEVDVRSHHREGSRSRRGGQYDAREDGKRSRRTTSRNRWSQTSRPHISRRASIPLEDSADSELNDFDDEVDSHLNADPPYYSSRGRDRSRTSLPPSILRKSSATLHSPIVIPRRTSSPLTSLPQRSLAVRGRQRPYWSTEGVSGGGLVGRAVPCTNCGGSGILEEDLGMYSSGVSGPAVSADVVLPLREYISQDRLHYYVREYAGTEDNLPYPPAQVWPSNRKSVTSRRSRNLVTPTDNLNWSSGNPDLGLDSSGRQRKGHGIPYDDSSFPRRQRREKRSCSQPSAKIFQLTDSDEYRDSQEDELTQDLMRDSLDIALRTAKSMNRLTHKLRHSLKRDVSVTLQESGRRWSPV